MARGSFVIRVAIAVVAGLLIRFSLVLFYGWVAAVVGLCLLCYSFEDVQEKGARLAISAGFLLSVVTSQLYFLFPYAQTHGWGSLLLIPIVTLCYGAVFVILIIIPKRISSHWVLLSFLFADYAFAKYPVGSPLMQLGTVAVDIPGIASAYSMTGPFWITLWVALIACVIFNTATQKPVRKHVWAFLASVPLLCPFCACWEATGQTPQRGK